MTDIVFIVGPTASGKSELALSFARKLNGVIINADSMQIYKEIPIITSSPITTDKQKIKHYLYNHISIFDIPKDNGNDLYDMDVNIETAKKKLSSSCVRYSVAQYLHEACATIRDVINEGYMPIIVGGTGMYIKALTQGLHPIPNIDDNVREEVEHIYQNHSLFEFYQKLIKLDRLAEKHICPTDSQRIKRAYEVVLQTQRSLFYYHTLEVVPPLKSYKIRKIVLMPERQFLYKRCNDRFINLISNGGLEEVESVKRYYNYVNSSAKKALGLHEIILYLTGKTSIDEAVRNAQMRTRQYAKRQYTWFKNQSCTTDQILHYKNELELRDIISYANIN